MKRADIGAFNTRARVLRFNGEGGEFGAWDGAGAFWCRMERTRVSGYVSMPGLAAEGWRLTLRERRLSTGNCLMIAGQRHWVLDVTPPEAGYMTVTTVTVPTVTVTLYNVRTTVDTTTMTDVVENNITVLREVLIASSSGADATEQGARGRDSSTLYIPFGSVAVDGSTGEHKRYVAPEAYDTLEDTAGVWTLKPGTGCFYIRGEIVEPAARLQELSEVHQVFVTGGIAVKDFYSLRHFEVTGT